MKNRILQGGDSYPSRLAGIKGGPLRSRVEGEKIRRSKGTPITYKKVQPLPFYQRRNN
jgi:hypothetical protein